MLHTVGPSLNTSLPVDGTEIVDVSIARFVDGQESPSYPIQRYFKLVFIEDGEGSCSIDSHLIRVASGTLVLIAPDKVRDLSGLKMTKRWVIVFATDTFFSDQTKADVWLRQPDEFVWALLLQSNDTGVKHFQVAPDQCSRWLERVHQLDFELQNRLPGSTGSVRALLWLLLIDTARLAIPQGKNFSPQLKPLLKDIFQFIETHYCHQISLLDVAKVVNLSPGYLTTFMRRETGQTVLSWIIERRMAKARRLLLLTEQSIEQIAEAVGYTDTNHFIRQFRQRYDSTPQQWRRTCLNYQFDKSELELNTNLPPKG